MEGDFSSASVLLQEYHKTLHDRLRSLANTVNYDSIFRMINVMVTKLEVYEREALRCDAIIISTIMNPRCRTKFFDLYYPSHATHAKKLIRKLYDELVAEKTVNTDQSTLEPTSAASNPVKKDKYNVLALDPQALGTDDDQLDRYLEGRNSAKNLDTLAWWMVSFPHYPCLFFFSLDFLTFSFVFVPTII